MLSMPIPKSGPESLLYSKHRKNLKEIDYGFNVEEIPTEPQPAAIQTQAANPVQDFMNQSQAAPEPVTIQASGVTVEVSQEDNYSGF